MSNKNWQLNEEGKLLRLTLNRAGKRNSLTPETLFELRDIVAMVNGRSDIWVVQLEAAGDHFSVGFDVSVIGQMIGQAREPYEQNLRELQLCLDGFEALQKPTVAKVQGGYCLGGGLLLALCCDFQVVSETAVFGLPEVKRSIAVVMGTQRLTRLAGRNATKEMILLADNFSAAQAVEYGLFPRTTPDAELETAVATLTDKLLQLPPQAVTVAKQIINEGAALSLRDSQELEIARQFSLLETADFQEAIASFFEKRPPRYQNR